MKNRAASLIVCVMLCVPGGRALAGPMASQDQLYLFATCAGRLSAMMEHQWSHDTARADHTAAQRDTMVELVSAIVPPGAGREALSVQVAAKAAFRQLLQRAVNTRDPDDSAWAARRAEDLLRPCTEMLL